ncbi:MAG: integrase [bacterium]|nr:integrase [bacterium]
MFKILLLAIAAAFRSRQQIALENLALRHQLAVLQRTARRPRLKTADRALWVWISRSLGDWKRHLTVVQPETVIGWHRLGWRLYWRRKSRKRRPGRPIVEAEVRDLIHRLSVENPLWGAPHIHGELLKLGYDVGEATVSKYMAKRPGPPSQSWHTFLRNHGAEIVAIDFLTVPTATFRVLYVFVVLSLDRRRIVHFNVTDSPTAEWTSLQLIQAFPFDTAPRYVIVCGERHLRRVLQEYIAYYHESRTHLGLGKDAPEPRATQSRGPGDVISEPVFGGLHHRYWRQAA